MGRIIRPDIHSEQSLLEVENEVTKTEFYQKAVIEEEPHLSPSLVFLLYQFLPLSLISLLWGWITSLVLPQPLNIVSVRLYAILANCDVSEAEYSDLSHYKTVSQFFTRRLKPGLRPICSLSSIVSPADGTLTYSGPVRGKYLEQVKGVKYSLPTFLGPITGTTDVSRTLYQAVVYLSPADYHRFHSPVSWTVTSRRHFPGALCSVDPRIVGVFPGLFHTNERVVFLGHWSHGFFAMVAVGATNVGSIVADFDPDLRTNKGVEDHYRYEVNYEKPIIFQKGEDFGYFNFGSTIVLIFEAPSDCDLVQMKSFSRVKVGQRLMR